MLTISMPAGDNLILEHLVLDYNGTIALDGKIISGVREKLHKLSESIQIHILTADTFGSSAAECRDLVCTIHLLDNTLPGTAQKLKYLEKLPAAKAAAIGNGTNDTSMLRASALGIAVMGGEGLSVSAAQSADIIINDINDALDLLLNPKRLIATLRR